MYLIKKDTPIFFGEENFMEQVKHLKEIYTINNELIAKEEELSEIKGQKSELEEKLKKMLDDYKGKQENLKSMKVERKNKELEVDEIAKRIINLKEDQMLVKTNEDYSKLLMKLDSAKEEKLKKEDEVLDFMEKIEDTEDILRKMQKESKTKQSEYDKAKTELDKREKRLKSEIKDLLARYDEINGKLSEDNRETIENIERKFGKKIITTVKDGYCQGCFIAVPPEIVSILKSGERVITCLNCGRILISIPEEN